MRTERVVQHISLSEYMALLRSGKVVNFWAQPGMNERGIKDFWERHYFGNRYRGAGEIINFEEWRRRLRPQEMTATHLKPGRA